MMLYKAPLIGTSTRQREVTAAPRVILLSSSSTKRDSKPWWNHPSTPNTEKRVTLAQDDRDNHQKEVHQNAL